MIENHQNQNIDRNRPVFNIAYKEILAGVAAAALVFSSLIDLSASATPREGGTATPIAGIKSLHEQGSYNELAKHLFKGSIGVAAWLAILAVVSKVDASNSVSSQKS